MGTPCYFQFPDQAKYRNGPASVSLKEFSMQIEHEVCFHKYHTCNLLQVEPKRFEFQISESDREHLELRVHSTIPITCSTPHCVVIVNVVQEDESGQAVLSDCQLEFWKSNHPQQKKFNVTAKRDKILDGNRVMHIQLKVDHRKKFTPDVWKTHLPIPKVKV